VKEGIPKKNSKTSEEEGISQITHKTSLPYYTFKKINKLKRGPPIAADKAILGIPCLATETSAIKSPILLHL